MQKRILLGTTFTLKKLIKKLVKLSGDEKLHLSWQVENWNKDVRNGLNIKEIDTENDSNQDGFSKTK
jgi:hypothetical protein